MGLLVRFLLNLGPLLRFLLDLGLLVRFLLALGTASTVFAELGFCNKDGPDAFKDPYIMTAFILALLGKFFIAGSFAVVYNITAELFPTQVRSNAVGICSMASRIGGMMSPVFISLYDIVSWLPGAIFGGFAVIAGFLSFYLPDTYGVPMLMSFEEADSLYRGVDIAQSRLSNELDMKPQENRAYREKEDEL